MLIDNSNLMESIKFSQVVGAKIVTNANMPGARCYGYVTMASAEDARKSIKATHRSELHGRVILVEKARDRNDR